MADRVYPAAKPNLPPGAAAANGTGAAPPASFPAPKPQTYQRPIYRPQAAPTKRRRGRSCHCSFCCCFCWALLALILLVFAAAVAGGAFYLLYHPRRPSFTVSSVKLTSLSLNTSSSSPTAASPTLTDAVALTFTARNPNKKMVYVYDDLTVSLATAANAVPLGVATVPGFTHAAGNTTVLTATASSNAVTVDPTGAASDIKKNGRAFSVVVDADTSAGVRVGEIKTRKIGIRIHCEGIKLTVPPPAPAPRKVTGKNGTADDALAPAPAANAAPTTTVSTAAHSCKVRVRVKIWKFTF